MEKLPMDIMGCQYQSLHEALAGYQKTGIPLIAYDGNAMKPAGLGDDIGIYYVIPKIAHALGISIDQSINVFFTSVICISLFFGIIGALLYFKKWSMKSLVVVELILLAYRSSLVGAIYTILSSITIAIVPLFLYFTKRRKLSLPLIIFLLWAGVAIGMANQLRSYSGTGLLIFMIIILLFYLQIGWKQRIILVALTIASTLAPTIYFDQLLNRRDAYLRKNLEAYVHVPRRHVLWHSVYIGLGFLNNEYGIKYRDEVAIEKVRLISHKAAYLSQEYEKILRDEVFRFIKSHRLFTAQTIFSKFGVISLYLLIFANAGLMAAAWRRKSWQIETAFWSALLFSSLFGILVIPDYRYLMGFIVFATLYGITSINEIVENMRWGQILALMHLLLLYRFGLSL
jgi:hypothetical protein